MREVLVRTLRCVPQNRSAKDINSLASYSTTYPCSNGRGWFLKKIPQILLVLGTFAFAELFLFALSERFRFLAHFLVNMLLALVVLVLAATLKVELIDAPICKIVAERQHAHFIHQMKLAGAIEVENRAEGLGMPVEEILVIDQGVIVAELGDRLVGIAIPQPT